MYALRHHLRVPVTALMIGCNLVWTLQSNGEVLIKTNSGANTYLTTVLPTAGTVQGVDPTANDILSFRNDITAATTFRLMNGAGTLSLQGLQVFNPSGAITIQNNAGQDQTLSIGSAGIDLSMATNNLILNNNTSNTMSVLLQNAQAATWSVASGRTLQVTSNISGNATGLTINPGVNGLGGTVNLGGSNTFTGATTVNNSALILDYTSAANRLDSGSSLNLNRGTVTVQGGALHTQTVAGLNVGSGVSQLLRGGTTAAINVGAINRSSALNSMLNVGTAGFVTTTAANTNGILGGWAVVNNSDWAVGGGAIAAYASYTDRGTTWTNPNADQNVRITGSSSGIGATTFNSLKFNGNFTLTQTTGTTMNIVSGGILKNDNTTSTLTGGNLTAGGTANGSPDAIYIWQNQNKLTIASAIVNNGADVVHLNKAGAGELELTSGSSTYTGVTTVANGRLTITNPNAINKAGNIELYGNSGADNTGSLQWNTATAAAITGNITGAAGNDSNRHALRKLTSGVLTLTPNTANTYSGSTLIDAGTLQAGKVNAFSPNSRVQFANVANAVLNLGGFNNTVRGLAGGGATGGNVSLGTAVLTLASLPNDALSYAGVISGAGGVTKIGGGQQTFTSNQTFTGSLIVDEGTLITAGLASTNVTVQAGGVLQAGNLVSATTIAVNGNGSLQLKPGGSLAATPAVTLNGNGASLQLANGANQLFNSFSSSAGSRLLIGSGNSASSVTLGNGVTQLNGVIAMSSYQGSGLGSLIRNASTSDSTLTLSGGNAYNGETIVNGGKLAVSPTATVEVLPDSTALTLNGSGLVLNNRSETIGSLAGSGTVELGSGTLTVGGNGQSTIYTGVISGTGSLIKAGAGTLALTGGNTFTGGLNIQGGTVDLGRLGGDTLASTLPVQVQGMDARLLVSTNQTLSALSAGPNTKVGVAANATLTVNQGAGTQTIIAADGDTDTRVIRLRDTALASTLRPGMRVRWNGSESQIPDGAYITQVLSDGQVLLNVTPVNGDFTNKELIFETVSEITGTLEGAGDFVKSGSGTLVLAANHTLSGTIKVDEGRLQVGGINANGRNWLQDIIGNQATLDFSAARATVLDFASNVASTGTLVANSPFERIGALSGGFSSVGGSTTINLTGGTTHTTLAVGGNNATTTFKGHINGGSTTALIKEGTGKLTWQIDTTSNTAMSGTIRVDAGELAITGAAGLNPVVKVSVSNQPGAVLSLTPENIGTAQTVSTLSGGGRGAVTSFANGSLGALAGNFIGQTGGEIRLVDKVPDNGILPQFIVENATANAVMRYGGAITGEGSLTKRGPNTLELYGDNTYTGVTTVVVGLATDNTTSTLRLGAYGLSSGVGTLSASGFGRLPATTRLELLAFSTNRNAAFDLNGASQTVSSLISDTVGGTSTVFLRDGELTLNALGTVATGNFTGSFADYGTINVLATQGSEGWTLSGDSNLTQRGFLNISGGKVTLNRAGGSLGDAVHVTLNGGSLAVRETDTIGSLSGTGSVTVSPGKFLTISSAPSGGIADKPWSGQISGDGGLTLATGGSIRITSAQSYNGNTVVNSGSALYLDYGSTSSNLIPASSTLRLNGGNIFLSGSVGQSVGAAVLGSGNTVFSAALPASSGAPTSMLTLNSLTRDINTLPNSEDPGSGGGVLQVRGSSLAVNMARNTSGVMGGFATYHAVDTDGNPVVSWAVPNPSTNGGSPNPVTGLPNSSYSAQYALNVHTDVTGNNTATSISGDLESLRFNTQAPVELFIGGLSTLPTNIHSGGILVTPAVGSNDVRITGFEPGATLTGGQGSSNYRVRNELIVHQHNTRGSLTIDAIINDNANATRLTKTGQGTLVLTQPNTYSGQTSILAGVLELATSASNPSFRGELGNVLGNLAIQNYGYLSLNQALPASSESYVINNNITGTGILRKKNTGTVILSGGNSNYTGPTQVLGGKLSVSSFNALGSTAGLTTVFPQGTLEIRGTAVPEQIVLQGGTLASAVGTSSISGPVILTQNSTVASPSAVNAELNLAGPVTAFAGAILNVAGGTAQNPGRVTLSNSLNQIDHVSIGANASLQVGSNTTGSLGRGTLIDTVAGSTFITNTSNSQMVFNSVMSGGGRYIHVRNIGYVVGDNSYTGETIVGGNGVIGVANFPAELRVGADTYTGALGTGKITIQATTSTASGSNSVIRYILNKGTTLNNNIDINPANEGLNVRNAYFIRAGLGSVNLAGTITAGDHSSGNLLQRAHLQSDGGGKLVISGVLNTGVNSQLNIINNGFIVFANNDPAYNQDLWAVISVGNHTIFKNAGTMTLRGINTNNGAAYIKRGKVIVDNSSSLGLHDDMDLFVTNNSTLEFNSSDTVGLVSSQRGSTIRINAGNTLTMNDATTSANYGKITGGGALALSADGGPAWYGLFGQNDFSGGVTIGSLNQTTTVRVDSLPNSNLPSSLGTASEIFLGLTGSTSTSDARLEYTGLGESTDRTFSLQGGANSVFRIAGSGRGALILDGPINVTENGNKTLHLHGQTVGNTVNGVINETGVSSVLSLVVNSAAANNDMYGAGRWILTNAGNNFSGNVTVNMGVLELAGDLGDGAGATSVFGNLTVDREIDLGTANFDGRRFDVFGGGDGLGAAGGAPNFGTLLFNDPGTGTANFSTKIKFAQKFSNGTNPGSGELINNGNKVVKFAGTFTSGADGSRNWILDGTNTGDNTISGVISDSATTGTGHVVGVLKEGTGRWVLSGANTYEGTTTVNRGILEINGGFAIHDNGLINLSNAGSDGSASGPTLFRVLQSETVGGFSGTVGTELEIAGGQVLTVRAAAQTYNGIVSGAGGLTRSHNDNTGRDTTLTNFNTYTGPTRVSASTNTPGTSIVNRFNVLFMANGGSASGIGASSSAASNLVFDNGINGGGLRWIGTGPQSTDRLFTLGAGTGAGAIWSDGQFFGDNAASLSFTNTGAIAFLAANTAQTLTLRGGALSENVFAPLLGNNGTGVTSLIKNDGGMWVLTNANSYTGGTVIAHGTLAIANSSALGSGNVTITGGIINNFATGLQLRGGIAISNNVIATVGDAGLASASGNNTLSGNLTFGGGTFRLGVNEGSTLNILGDLKNSVGSGRLAIYDRGTLILSGASDNFGATSISGGTTILNYDTGANGKNVSKLSDGSALELGFSGTVANAGITTGLGAESDVNGQTYQPTYAGATVVLSGGSHAEVVGSLLLNNGASRILRTSGTSTLNVNGITRSINNGVNDYGTIDFGAAGFVITSSTNTSGGILGANGAFATVDRTNWAVAGASGAAISALATYAANDFGTNKNTDITQASVSAAANTTTHTIRFNTNNGGTTTLNLGGALLLETGGILVTKNVTDDVVISGASGIIRRSSTNANLDTIIHHHGSGLLSINAVLANNTGLMALTKAGLGTVVLNGANTYTGRVNLQQGILQVGDGTAATSTARLGNGGNPLTMSDGATLLFNVANGGGTEFVLGAMNGGGLLRLAASNQSILTLASDNVNWVGDILVEGGTLRIRGSSNALGNVRGTTTIRTGARLDINGASGLNFNERMILENGALFTVTNNGGTNSSATMSGHLTLQNTSAAGLAFNVGASQALTLSGMLKGENGFTKTGNGVLTISGNQYQDFMGGATHGTTTPNANPALKGQVIIEAGEVRLGNPRALGATGVGNETIVRSGASLDIRGQALNFFDDPDLFREIIQVSGSGTNGTGALKNSNGLGTVSTIRFDGNATLSGGGYSNGYANSSSRLVLAAYDTNPNTSSTAASALWNGNFDRVDAVIDGRNADLTILGGTVAQDGAGANVTFRDPNFVSALNSINIREGIFRIDEEAGVTTAYNGLHASNITNGITIGYGGASLADNTNAALGVGPNVGSRLNFYRSHDTIHTVKITMDGVLAKQNGGANYIDLGTDTTIPNPRTYLNGEIVLTGDADRNIFHIDASSGQLSVGEQGNMTGVIQSKLIIGGQITGSGGLTKTGVRELRLTNNNTFTGAVNVLRSGTAAMAWQDNTVSINGVNYQTYGDAEGWGEWGLTLSGVNGAISQTQAVNLQRRGLIVLDNTSRLNQTNQVGGGNNNDRIYDGADINFNHGWLKIIGGTENNTEQLATQNGAKLNVLSGSNIIDLMPTDSTKSMTLRIGEITRSPGSLLLFNNLDSSSKFSTDSGPGSVRVLLDSIGTLQQSGSGMINGQADRKIVIGMFGGITPHQYQSDIRTLGFNNAGVSDYLNQIRNTQWIASSHFMAYDGNVLRPLDDSEYHMPTDGLLDAAAGKNVNLSDPYTIMRKDMSINALRFGVLADNNGDGLTGTRLNSNTSITDTIDAHSLQLYVDGSLTIDSGMISSAYYSEGNISSLSTLIVGGTLNFGTREAIILNQNATLRSTDGALPSGNLEIRSSIAGSGGLLKSGFGTVVLDGRNTYTGTTTVSNGVLFLRNGRSALGAGGEGNGVVVEGNGNLYSGNGIQVGAPGAFETILVKALQGNQQVMRTDNDLTNWYANLIIDNVDAAGQVLFTPIVRAEGSATSVINGNIYGGSSAVTSDVAAIDPRIVQFDSSGNNTFIFRGQFGDRGDASGNAIPVADRISTLPTQAGVRTNENEVLRVNLNGASGETNYVMEKQYNAAGRLTVVAGNLLVTYDPNDPTRDGSGFYTDTALSKIPNADSNTNSFATNGGTTFQGFILGSASNNTGSLLLTKPGQHFNMAAWTATGSGVKFVGGLNETGEVRFGSSTATGNLSIGGTALRLYSSAGGSVVIDNRITGNPGTAPNNVGFIKVGRGNVTLRNSTNTTAGDSGFQISGGKLILDHSGQNVALLGNGSTTGTIITPNAIFSGGVVHAQSNLAAATTIGYSFTSNTNSVLQIQNGTTEIIAEGRGTRTMTVNMGNANANSNRANLTRAVGGAMNLVEAITGNGNGVITLNFNNFTTALLKNRAITWSTYSNTPREALDFAMVDAGAPVANRVKAYNRLASEYVNDVSAWADRMNVSENGGAGFFGTLASSRILNTLRFDSMADSVVTLASGVTLSLSGDGGAGGLLVSSNTGSSNKTITGGSISGSGSSPEIVVHQYGKGNLTIASNIVGSTNLTIAGPSTTSPENFGTTGVVKLTGNNTYTGQTFVNGGVLEFGSMSALGTSPQNFSNNRLTLNGGTVRWTGGVAALGNRGVMLQGDGGVFDIANASGNLVIGGGLTVANGLNSQEIFRGDLVKTGAGALTLLGTHGNFQGLMDVRQGSLVLVSDVGNAGAGTVSVLGSNRSWADGTVMRQGTNLQVFLGNANNSGDWNIEEFFTFEGNNTFTYGGLLDINANLAADGVLSGSQFNMGNRRPLNLNGILDIKGTTTFDVANFGVLRLNNGTGYLTGSGDIVKDGGGRMEFRANVPDWKGSLVIKQGTVWAANQADVIGTGYASGKTITLGDSERTGLAEFMIYSPDNPSIQGWIFDINHDINVTYNPLQTKRLGIESSGNDTVTAYNGNITLNDNLVVVMRDSINMPVGGEQYYLQLNGRLKDGATTSGNILVQTDEATNTGVNDATTARTYGYAVLNGDNSAWTGDITISNNAAYNHDSTTILRLGNAKALTAANDVTMNFNSILQAGGQNVTIGNLNTLGGTGAFFGNSGSMSSTTNSSSEIIENASATPGVLTITQSTPATYEAVWDAFFRDGTLNSNFFAPGANVLQPSASLGVTKAGNGWATLSLDNDYTGPTVVQQGILQVGRNGIGDTGRSPSISNPNMMTTVMNGATIAGTGIVQGKLTIQSGGILSTGDQAGKAIGTLFVSGDVMLASGSQALLQLRNATYNNPGALTASDQNYSFWRNGVMTDEFSAGLNSMVTGSQHDMLTASGTINWAPGAKIRVQNDGYTPKAGDIFRLFKGSGYLGTVNVGPVLRKGGDDLAFPNLDLILFALGGNLMWDTSLFNSAGILMVVEADTAIKGVLAPSFTQAPSANIDLSEPLEPGTSVTLSALAETPDSPQTPVTYQWYLEESPVLGATSASYTFEANFATKGKYSVAASNAGGTTIHPDKVEVLVNDVPDITSNPSSATVAPGSSHTFGVQSRGQAPFTYQWYKNDQAIQGATGQFYSLTNIQEADEGNYHVVVTNSVASATSTDAVLDVIDGITSVVASVTPADAYLGQEIRFTVVHDGEGEITYQWRRNGNNISGATSATYVIPGATAAADGSYTVAVTNEVGTKVSNAVTLALQNPVVTIVTPPQSRTLLSGQSLDLKVVARGLPTLRYAWKKNNAVLANVFTADISKLNENGTGAALTDGGTYTVEVSNAQSKASTIANPAEVVVVDSTPRYLPVAEKGVATLTPVIAAGPKTPLSYKWVRIGTRTVMDPGPDMIPGNDDDIPLQEETETELVSGSGVGQASVKAYKITGVTAVANNGFYRLKVTGPDGVTVTGNQYELRVFTALPEFENPAFVFDTALIGRDYRFQVPVKRIDTTIWPDKITAAGLPPGLKIDPISGVITGKPTATKVGGYKVTITLANKFGKVTSTGTLNVLDLNQTVPGTWVGVVGRNAALGDNLGGRVDLTVTSKATFTGKLLLGGTTYSFAGPLNVNTVPYTGSVYIKRAGNPAPDPLRLDFALDPVSNRFTSGLITDGVTNLAFTGWRQIFNKVLTASTYVGYYTMAVGLSDNDPLYTANPNGTKNVPLGAGYASFTVAADGKLTIAGKMPDGETLTNATFVGPDGELAVFQHMYKALKPGGSLVGQFKIDDKVTLPGLDPGNEDNTIEGNATWVRPASTKATDRTFKAGFGLPGTPVPTPLTVVASGGRYVAPASGFSVLNIPEPQLGATPANNAEIDFINGGDLGYSYESFGRPWVSKNPDVRVYVIKGSKVTVLSTTPNETKTALTAVPKTGLLSGSFSTKDFSPIYPAKPEYITRSVKFQGVIIKETGDGGQPSYVGVGYFLLPQLPKPGAAETDKTTPFYSGRFVFEKL